MIVSNERNMGSVMKILNATVLMMSLLTAASASASTKDIFPTDKDATQFIRARQNADHTYELRLCKIKSPENCEKKPIPGYSSITPAQMNEFQKNIAKRKVNVWKTTAITASMAAISGGRLTSATVTRNPRASSCGGEPLSVA